MAHTIVALTTAGTRRLRSIGFVAGAIACLALYHFEIDTVLFGPDDLISAIHTRIKTTVAYGGPGNPPVEQHPRFEQIQAIIASGQTVQNPPFIWIQPQMPFFLYIGRAFAVLVYGAIAMMFAQYIAGPHTPKHPDDA